MKKKTDNTPTMVAAFNSNYLLTAIFNSISEASTLTKCLRQSIIKAAYGNIIRVGKMYWRVIPKDMVLESDDLGRLTLFEFDGMVGLDRKIYCTSKDINKSSMLESEYIKSIKKQ